MAEIADLKARSCVGTQLLSVRYRCVDDAVSFVTASQPRTDEGFFRFGENVICYGHCASGDTQRSPTGPLHDALEQAVVETSQVHLSFDPARVIENLRGERYLATAGGLKAWPGHGFLRSAYYLFRPLMPVPIRKQLQKLYFRGWERIRFPEWPVDVTVEHIHENLLLLALKARNGKPIPFIWFWPKGAPSCTIVTHDVETQSGLDKCSDLMNLNDSFGIKTSFQVVPEERYKVSNSVLAEIRDRGFEVNVHDLNHDGHLFRDRAEFLRRAEMINHYVRSSARLDFGQR